jgi:hypothetical protein
VNDGETETRPANSSTYDVRQESNETEQNPATSPRREDSYDTSVVQLTSSSDSPTWERQQLQSTEPLSAHSKPSMTTSFASVCFSKYLTIIFYQSRDNWIQCCSVQHAKVNQVVLLDPVVQAVKDTLLCAVFLPGTKHILRIFYAIEENGERVLSEHTFDWSGSWPCSWTLSTFKQLNIRIALWLAISHLGPDTNDLSLELESGKIVFLRHQDGKGWVEIHRTEDVIDIFPGSPIKLITEQNWTGPLSRLAAILPIWHVSWFVYQSKEGKIVCKEAKDWPI